MADFLDAYPLAQGAPAAPPAPPGAPEASFLDAYPLAPIQQAAPPRAAVGLAENIQAGFEASVPVLAWRGKLPSLVMDPEHSKWWERLAGGLAQVVPDLSVMIPGGMAGGAAGTAVGGPVGGILGAGAVSFGPVDGLRAALMSAYRSKEAQTPIDFWNILKETATATAKGSAVGAATFGAGAVARAGAAAALGAGAEVAGKVGLGTASVASRVGNVVTGTADVAAQIATMTTMPRVFEEGPFRWPEAREFADGAAVILALKGAHVGINKALERRVQNRMEDTYVKTGKTPADQVADAQADPKLAAELAETTGTTDGVPIKLDRLIAEAENLARGSTEPPKVKDLIKDAQVPRGTETSSGVPIQFDRLIGEAEQLGRGAIPEAPRVADLLKEIKAKGPLQTDMIEEMGGLLRDTVRLTEIDRKPDPTAADRAEVETLRVRINDLEERIRKTPTLEAHDRSAQRIFDDFYEKGRLVDEARAAAGAKQFGEDHNRAVATLVRRNAETLAKSEGILPEQVFQERQPGWEDASQRVLAAAEAAIPEGAVRFTPPEVDMFGAPVDTVVPRFGIEGMETKEVPLKDLTLSKEVPQFKKDANVEGVITPLGGSFDRVGVGPIQVWERLDGSLEVISGRHRLDLARRSGEETIPAQVHRESEGFDARQAATLDAQLNIREEQGSVADYAQYFKDSGISKEAAEERGLLARAKGRQGFAIARDGIPDLQGAHRAGLVSDEAAFAISVAAPGNEALQNLGMKIIQDGKSNLFAVNMMRSAAVWAADRKAEGAQGDIFGGIDDSAMVEMSRMAKLAGSEQRSIAEKIAAVQGAVKRPEVARKMGVDVQDPEGIQKRIVELRQEQYMLDNWPLYPEIVARLRELKQDAIGAEPFDLKPETPAELAARNAEAAAQARRKLAEEAAADRKAQGKPVTVDQADLFNTQDTLFQSGPAERWYSELGRQVEAAKMNQAPAQGWKDWLRGLKGVKAEEVKWSGLEEFLDLQPGKVTKEQVSEFLRGNGVKVTERELGGQDGGAQARLESAEQAVIAQAMRDKAMEGMPLFQEHRASYQVAEKLISTMENSDKSSVVHELGHHFLENLKYFASRPGASARTKEMWEVARKEFAIGEDGNISRGSHETNARTFERYLADGEAPTPALRSVFEQFRTWMLEIYNDVKNIVGVRMNPEVKDLFDRMLATDQEIQDARELNVPRAYVAEAKASEARKIVPGFKSEQVALQPYADELPKGPGEAPSNSHVNYDTVNSEWKIKLTLQRLAELDQENIQKQRGGKQGVETWEQEQATMEKQILDTLGGGQDKLGVLRGTDPDGPKVNHRLRAMKQMMTGAGRESERLRDTILEKGHNATIEEQLQYLSSIELLSQLHAEFLGERAAVGRAMNALKDTTEGSAAVNSMLEAIGRGADANTLFQSAAEKAAADQAFLKAKLDDILLNYQGKSVLDIAKLHKEIGTLKGAFKFAKEMEKATTWEKVIEAWKAGLLSGPQTPVVNVLGTWSFQALRAPVDLLASVIGMARGASPGMGESDRASMSESLARITGPLGGIQEALKLAWHAMKVDEPSGKTESYKQAIPGLLGDIIRFPFRLMSAGDVLTTTMYKRGEMKTLAIRKAFDEELNPMTGEFGRRVQELMDNPTPEMVVEADRASTRMAFNDPGGERTRAVQTFVNKWNLQWMIPFIRTPLNITEEMARMTPLAPLSPGWRSDFQKGGVARDKAIAEVVVGSGIMALTMAYAFNGQITGSGNPDRGKNKGKEGVEQPNSIKIGNTYYEIGRLQPGGTLMVLAADVANAWEHMNEEEKDKVPKILAMAFANAVTNQTFLQGITNVVHMMSEPDRYGSKFFQGLAGSLVPNIVGQPTAMADPYVRQVNSMLEAVQARIPVFREQLFPKPDWLGEPTKNKERLGVVLPVRVLDVSEDKVRLEAARLEISMSDAPKKLHVGGKIGKLGGLELTPEERNKFAKVGGEMAHKILAQIVNAPSYDKIPDMIKKILFSDVLSASHQMAALKSLTPEKRQAYLQQVTEKVAAELAPE